MESDHNFYSGLVENMSVSGVFVATHVLLRIGDRMQFSLRLGDSEELIHGTGEVKWTRQYSDTSDAPPGLGVRFVDLSCDARDRIHEFIRAREPILFED